MVEVTGLQAPGPCVNVGVIVTPVGVNVGVRGVIVGVKDGVMGGVPGVHVSVGVKVRVGVKVGVLVAPPPEYQTRTGIQSSEKSREVLLETLTIRTRKLALVNSLVFHARPQVSVELPRVSVRSVVARVGPVFSEVQVMPLSHESCTQK
jgi:hypothetical protein